MNEQERWTKTDVKTADAPSEFERLVQGPARIGPDFSTLTDGNKFAHMQRVATLFAASQIIPAQYRNNVADCFIALQMSTRAGVDPFMWMQNTYVVYGRPGIQAVLAIALVNASGLFKDGIAYEIQGGDDPFNKDYRVRAYAVRQNGTKVEGPWIDWKLIRSEGWDKHRKDTPSKWTTMPGQMFLYRSAMWFARAYCPEVILGMNSVDELIDIKPESFETLENAPKPTRSKREDAAPVPNPFEVQKELAAIVAERGLNAKLAGDLLTAWMATGNSERDFLDNLRRGAMDARCKVKVEAPATIAVGSVSGTYADKSGTYAAPAEIQEAAEPAPEPPASDLLNWDFCLKHAEEVAKTAGVDPEVFDRATNIWHQVQKKNPSQQALGQFVEAVDCGRFDWKTGKITLK